MPAAWHSAARYRQVPRLRTASTGIQCLRCIAAWPRQRPARPPVRPPFPACVHRAHHCPPPTTALPPDCSLSPRLERYPSHLVTAVAARYAPDQAVQGGQDAGISAPGAAAGCAAAARQALGQCGSQNIKAAVMNPRDHPGAHSEALSQSLRLPTLSGRWRWLVERGGRPGGEAASTATSRHPAGLRSSRRHCWSRRAVAAGRGGSGSICIFRLAASSGGMTRPSRTTQRVVHYDGAATPTACGRGWRSSPSRPGRCQLSRDEDAPRAGSRHGAPCAMWQLRVHCLRAHRRRRGGYRG